MKRRFIKKYSSFLSPKAKVGCSLIHKKGIFAKTKIKKAEIISIFGGDILSKKELKKLCKENKEYDNYEIKIAPGYYLATIDPKEENEPTDFFNHSCEPNAGFLGQIVLVAMRDILPGEEITYDYAMTDDEPKYKLKCHCGEKNCRKIISGNDWKIPALQKKYKGYFSWHIQEKIKKSKIKI